VFFHAKRIRCVPTENESEQQTKKRMLMKEVCWCCHGNKVARAWTAWPGSNVSVRRGTRESCVRRTVTSAQSTLASTAVCASTGRMTSTASVRPATWESCVSTMSTNVWHDRVPTAASAHSLSMTSAARALPDSAANTVHWYVVLDLLQSDWLVN